MKKFGTLRLFLLLILVLVLSVAPNISAYFSKANVTKQRLFGEPASEECVLVLWNVDTFEGGNVGKSAILEKVSGEFERQNKGAYVLVKNLTIQEFLMKGETEKPDIISFGTGLFDYVKDFALELGNGNNLLENVRSSLVAFDKISAYAWCMGAYFVLASEESLAGANENEDNLLKKCMECGYKKTVGKKEKQVFSLELGSSDFCSGKEALEKQVKFLDSAVDGAWQTQSYYDAYAKFVGGCSTFLLGTQRDLARLENKKIQGSISQVYGEALLSTDLVQYVCAVNSENDLKRDLSKAFCEFLTCDYVQKRLLSFGLLPTCKVDVSEGTSEILLEAYANAEKMEIKAIDARRGVNG